VIATAVVKHCVAHFNANGNDGVDGGMDAINVVHANKPADQRLRAAKKERVSAYPLINQKTRKLAYPVGSAEETIHTMVDKSVVFCNRN
jgi:hypothetical protein